MISSLFLSTAVSVGIIRAGDVDDGVDEIACGGNSMKWKIILVASYIASYCGRFIAIGRL